MSEADPFATYVSGATLLAIVKNLERRWGLTLVSFLPPEAQERLVQLQREISRLWNGHAEDSMCQGRLYIEFCQPQQFHCTHLTLTRSDPGGPVTTEKLVKKGHRLSELFRTIHDVTSQIQPIKAELDCLRIAYDGFGIVLLGEYVGEDSVRYRQTLLGNLNQALSKFLNLSVRSWDTDPSKFHEVHCSLGYLKRPPSQGYGTFVDDIGRIDFAPVSFTSEDVILVHHRYRTLAFPQEGSITFPLGKKVDIVEDEFIHKLNLA